MLRHMQRAIETCLGETGDFLKSFKAYGWYLDDLVLTPVNHIAGPQRKAKCSAARKSLSERIADYRPLAIVSLLKMIEKDVEAAAVSAGSNAAVYCVPFPGMGQQGKFHVAMADIIPSLPRL